MNLEFTHFSICYGKQIPMEIISKIFHQKIKTDIFQIQCFRFYLNQISHLHFHI